MIDEDAVDEIERLHHQIDELRRERDRLKDALLELEAASRRPFETIEHLSYLARRALDA